MLLGYDAIQPRASAERSVSADSQPSCQMSIRKFFGRAGSSVLTNAFTGVQAWRDKGESFLMRS